MIRAAAYCRISSDPHERAVGVRRQEDDCRKLADMREWSVVGAYIDNDRSAWNGKPRPEFQRLLADIERGGIDAVIVYQSSRLTRQPVELEAFISLHNRTGVRLVTTNGDIDLGSATGRFVARINGAQAAVESDQISERCRRAFRDMAERGLPHGGRQPYGFRNDRITHDDEEVAIIREIAEAVLAGESVRAIAARLNARGVTCNGRRWRHGTIRRILLSPRMIGMRSHSRSGLHPAKWLPIISEEEQTQLKAIFGDPARQWHAGRPAIHLLTSVLVCGNCGMGMRYLPGFGRNKAAYICPMKADGGCGSCAITADAAEAYVESVALDMADRDSIEDRAPSVDAGGAKARMIQLSEAFAREDITFDEYMAAKRVIEQRIATAALETARLASADRLRDRWPNMATDERREAILLILGKVTVTKPTRRSPRFNPDRIIVDRVLRPGTWSFGEETS